MMSLLDRYPRTISLLLLFIVWESAARVVAPRWLPPLTEVVVSGWRLLLDGRFVILDTTVQTLLIGLFVSFVVAAGLALALAKSRFLEETAEPFINAALATPTVALIPVYLLLWGFKDTTRVVTVISFALFPIVVTWIEALKQAPEPLLEMAHAFTAGPVRRLVTITLPAAAPMLLTGVRIGVVQGIKGVVSAEVIIGVIGIGQLLQESAFKLPQLYAVVSVLLILSVLVYLGLMQLEARLARRSQVG